MVKKIVISFLLILGIIIGNGCYWIFSDIQTKCAKDITNGKPLSCYDKASILTLHLGICTIGSLCCKDAAWANLFELPTIKLSKVYSKL